MPGRVPQIRYWRIPIQTSDGTIYAYKYEGLLASEGHYRKPSGSWSGGGPLYVHKESQLHGLLRSATYRYNGVNFRSTACGVIGTPSPPLPAVTSDFIRRALDEPAAWALRGYNRTKPGTPLVDLFVSGKELISTACRQSLLGGSLEVRVFSQIFCGTALSRDSRGG
uniref:Uncharacterized protein n=1 Tax=Leviviridae sp. TaxID=2027243 RepID=A0A514DCX6_9VIRU|nr:MAG: hypothetical protein H4Bulk46879_000001 [Leviviridae sp.]